MVPSVGDSAVSFFHSAIAASNCPREAKSWAFCRMVLRSTPNWQPPNQVKPNSFKRFCQGSRSKQREERRDVWADLEREKSVDNDKGPLSCDSRPFVSK